MNAPEIKTERIDDVPLLIESMVQMAFVDTLRDNLPQHPNSHEFCWGWTGVIWLAYILTTGDHRKSSMEEYVKNTAVTLSSICGVEVRADYFSTHRLGNLLRYLNDSETWNSIEESLNREVLEVYDIPQEVVRCDATTVSGYHGGGDDSLMQFGVSKDNSLLRQIKMMCASLDPLGIPLISDVVSGNSADDPLYEPAIKRVHESLKEKEVLYCGDCKLSSESNRQYIKSIGSHYLMPLALTGKIKSHSIDWIDEGILKKEGNNLREIYRENSLGKVELIARGYETTRDIQDTDQLGWKERVFVVQSVGHHRKQTHGLENRISTACDELQKLTPSIKRGKRQVTDEKKLIQNIDDILKKRKVKNLLTIEYDEESYVRKNSTIRFVITNIIRNEEEIALEKERFGWHIYVTDLAVEKLTLEKAVLCYRNEYRVERIFNRLKSHMKVAPLFVKLDHQIKGLCQFLTLGVRVLTLVEYQVRRNHSSKSKELSEYIESKERKISDKPTAEKILSAFTGITLTIIRVGENELFHIPPLSKLQKEILQRLKLTHSFYERFTESNIGIKLTN